MYLTFKLVQLNNSICTTMRRKKGNIKFQAFCTSCSQTKNLFSSVFILFSLTGNFLCTLQLCHGTINSPLSRLTIVCLVKKSHLHSLDFVALRILMPPQRKRHIELPLPAYLYVRVSNLLNYLEENLRLT